MMMQGQPPPMMMQGPPPQFQGPPPDMDPQEMMYRQQMMQAQQQMGQAQQPPPQQFVPQADHGALKSILKKSSFGMGNKMKYPIIVSIIFLLLNSKLVWRQIIQLPMMGGAEPSIIALVVNAVLAGIAFYFISKFV
jgi:hypothetical protein